MVFLGGVEFISVCLYVCIHVHVCFMFLRMARFFFLKKKKKKKKDGLLSDKKEKQATKKKRKGKQGKQGEGKEGRGELVWMELCCAVLCMGWEGSRANCLGGK